VDCGFENRKVQGSFEKDAAENVWPDLGHRFNNGWFRMIGCICVFPLYF
jgi:hypothetical protein